MNIEIEAAPPHTRLWLAVIARAVEDASEVHVPPATYSKWKAYRYAEGRREQQRARQWLLAESLDFLLVCEFAGLHPDAVHERALQLKETWT